MTKLRFYILTFYFIHQIGLWYFHLLFAKHLLHSIQDAMQCICIYEVCLRFHFVCPYLAQAQDMANRFQAISGQPLSLATHRVFEIS